MSNTTSQGRAATSDSPGSPTQAASSAAQQPAASASTPAASAPAATSAAAPRSSPPPPQQPASNPPASNPPASQAPASSAPTAAAPAQSNPSDPKTASPSTQNPPPAAAASSAPRNANTTAGATSAPAATSVAVPPAAATSSPEVANQSPNSASVVTVIPGDTSTRVQVVTSTTTQSPDGLSPSSSTPSSTSDPAPVDAPSSGAPGLTQPSKVAIGVVVPIAAIAILAILGLFWWRKRRARQEAEEERRKEVEDYAYNPNADPTMPAASGGHSADNSYEMREDSGSGYRGWGSTAAPGSMGRKTSTTMSGGGGGMVGAYSDPSSPTRGNPSEARSGEPLLDGSCSPEGEILGAMGPAAANNRGGDMRRGPSNASSSYSAGARSEGSDGGLYGNGSTYYEQYGQNPYGDQRPQDPASQAVIRDNPARRNTRIENSAHYPQQSAGIAQNF